MTFVKITIIIISIVFLINRFMPAQGVKQIRLEELSNNPKSKNKQLIDVRTRREYQVDHVKDFINIPLRQIHKDKETAKLDKSKETIVICQTGIRSMQACKKLQKLGFENLVNVKGGMTPTK